MRLPGASFLRDRAAVREFEQLDRSRRRLVFYSEGRGDWPHLGPIVTALLRSHDLPITYLTSDPADPGLAIDDGRVRAFMIGSGTARTVLFARIEAGTFVMTLPDLGTLWLKRSVHPVHYAYVFHSTNSTHTSYLKGAFDAYDTVLCVGPHHVEELRSTETLYGLKAKDLVEHGSGKLDTIISTISSGSQPTRDVGAPAVLVAPTWGESSFVESDIGLPTIAALVSAGLRTVVRLHPMTVRRHPGLMHQLERTFGSSPNFTLESDMSAAESWLRSDLMVSDWSGAATEYAFATGRPVAFVDTPAKIRNPEWTKIRRPSFEESIRRDVGRVVPPGDLDALLTTVSELTASDEYAPRIHAARSQRIFNIGHSAEVAATYLAAAART
jgi:hypothetical protein